MSDNVTKTFNLQRQLADELQDRAEEIGISESAFVRWAIAAALRNNHFDKGALAALDLKQPRKGKKKS